MPSPRFQPGNQLAARRITKGRFLTQSLISELNELDPAENMAKFRVMVRRLVERAIAPDADFMAIKEIFDRVEGRSVQAMEVSGRDGRPAEVLTVNMSLAEISRLYADTLGSDAPFEDETPEVEETATNVEPLS